MFEEEKPRKDEVVDAVDQNKSNQTNKSKFATGAKNAPKRTAVYCSEVSFVQEEAGRRMG